ncbi:hypothetical protein ESOMN_v1c03410 [Williamsoniiplasma somnilux]|uniref:Uncharacterized protein n=1 Tax=Williamsoniiplasma somnilux TaxID=215578 RepID=A0A2K8P1E6_9MOLU|nr:hypothetical protein [Williamsoniiplasma somnilux]ATZ18723.1 hypothetical protein ESOMN_v1c03410 [Williamsoniiplasma somnilux]
MSELDLKEKELEFVKRQENVLDQKINFLTFIFSVLWSPIIAFTFSNLEKFDTIQIVLIISVFLIIFISIVLLINPKLPTLFKKRNEEENTKYKKHNIYSDSYDNWNVENYERHLDYQIEHSLKIFRRKSKRIIFISIFQIVFFITSVLIIFFL